jgi:hypothetical protein
MQHERHQHHISNIPPKHKSRQAQENKLLTPKWPEEESIEKKSRADEQKRNHKKKKEERLTYTGSAL